MIKVLHLTRYYGPRFVLRKVFELWPGSMYYWGVLLIVGTFAVLRKATIFSEVYYLGPSEIWPEIVRLPSSVDSRWATAFVIIAAFFYGTRRIYAFHPGFGGLPVLHGFR